MKIMRKASLMMYGGLTSLFSTGLAVDYFNLTINSEGTREPYLHALDNEGVCSGIVSEVYVPDSFWSQNDTESQLWDLVNQLPAWLSPECNFAARKYLCASAFLYPERISLDSLFSDNGLVADAVGLAWASALAESYSASLAPNASTLLGYSFYAPSYPDHSVCTDYANACGGYLSRLAGGELAIPSTSSSSSSLNQSIFEDWMLPRCSASATYNNVSVDLFPVGSNQNVLQLSVSGLSGISLNLTELLTGIVSLSVRTKTNSLFSSGNIEDVSGFQTLCPSGFVIPDDLNHPRNIWVTGSGCALPCRLQLMSDNSYDALDNVIWVSSAISLPIILVVFVYWVSDKSRRVNYIRLVVYMACAVLLSVSLALLSFGGTPDETFCLNNAVSRAQEDGASACIVSAALFPYFCEAVGFAWMFQSIDVYIKFGGKLGLTNQRRVVELWNGRRAVIFRALVIFVLPLLLLIDVLEENLLGYNGYLSVCLYRESVPLVQLIYRSGALIVLSFIVGVAFAFPVLIRVTSTLRNFLSTRKKIRVTSLHARSMKKTKAGGDAIDNLAKSPSVSVRVAGAAAAVTVTAGPNKPAAAGGGGVVRGERVKLAQKEEGANDGDEKSNSDNSHHHNSSKATPKMSATVAATRQQRQELVAVAAEEQGKQGSGSQNQRSGLLSDVLPITSATKGHHRSSLSSNNTGVNVGGMTDPLSNLEQLQRQQIRPATTGAKNGASASATPSANRRTSPTSKMFISINNLLFPAAKPARGALFSSNGLPKSCSSDDRRTSRADGEDGNGADGDVLEELSWGRFASLLRANVSVLFFLFVHATVWSVWGIVVLFLAAYESDFKLSYKQWTDCVFNNYDNGYPDAWMDTCGTLPKGFNFEGPLFASYLAGGLYGALVCLMHFTSLVVSFTQSVRPRIPTFSRLIRLCGECLYDCVMMEDRNANLAAVAPSSGQW